VSTTGPPPPESFEVLPESLPPLPESPPPLLATQFDCTSLSSSPF
jgi:hypothetical protein